MLHAIRWIPEGEPVAILQIIHGMQEYIDRYRQMDGVLAWKMPGAGGGGYLALVVDDAETFCKAHDEAIALTIRRA